MQAFSTWMGEDLSGYDPDGPIPLLEPNATQSDPNVFTEAARSENLTLVEAAKRLSASKGTRILIGSTEKVADELALWVDNDAADGFILLPPTVSDSIDDYAELLVPELQRRGMFRKSYPGTTLRDTLGLERPERRG